MILHHLIVWKSENHPLSIQCVHTGACVHNPSNTVESHFDMLVYHSLQYYGFYYVKVKIKQKYDTFTTFCQVIGISEEPIGLT